MEVFHTPAKDWSPPGNLRRFSFVLLPPSREGVRNALEHLRRLPRNHPHSLMDIRFDWSRLDRIESLHPVARYVGTKAWKGYVVFEFQDSDRVILECPQTGNATYILQGNWRDMVSASKAELLSDYRRYCARIVHRQNWERNVYRAAFGSKGRTQRIIAVNPVALKNSQPRSMAKRR
jgi:hypothetical protein